MHTICATCARAGLAILAFTMAAPAYSAEAPSDPERVAAALIERALRDPLAMQIAESLTREASSRMAGSEGEAHARRWAIAKLTDLGFANVREEPFSVRPLDLASASASIVAPLSQPLAVVALGNGVATPPGGLEGELVRFATVAELFDAPAERVRGRIVLVDERMQRTRDGRGYLRAVAWRTQTAIESARRGALAALIRSISTDEHFPHTGSVRYAGNLPALPIAAVAGSDADTLTRLAAQGPVRVRLELGEQGGGHLGHAWEGAPGRMAASGNVIAEIPGRSQQLILLGAHLDAWNLGPGAQDDAAGVGIVIAAARLISQLPKPPGRTVRVVLFGSEEPGAAGAHAYAELHARELPGHVLALESDLGAGRVWQLQTRWHTAALHTLDAFDRVLAPLGIERGGNDSIGGPDLQHLAAAGVPIAALVQDATGYYDVHHSAADTLERIDAGALAQNVAAWAAFIYLAAESNEDLRPLTGAPVPSPGR